MTVHTQDCKFWIVDEVTIDNDKEMHGVVTEVLFKANDHVTYIVFLGYTMERVIPPGLKNSVCRRESDDARRMSSNLKPLV